MTGPTKALCLAAFAVLVSPAAASSIDSIVAQRPLLGGGPAQRGPMPPGGLECVPYARQLSGIRIYGDAHTWWGQASGRYARGHAPRIGAILAIRPHNNSRLGHVAAVTSIVDSRTILLSHANWSYRGRIERNVAAIDVSPANDWSRVRIWYGPAGRLGTTHWPVSGFIYNARPGALPDLGRERLTQVAQGAQVAPPRKAEPAAGRKPRHADPIGAIIAGTY